QDGKTEPPEEEPDNGTESPVEEEPTLVEDSDDEDEVVRDPNELVIELEEKLAAEHERLLRAAADLDNLRKRMKRDVEEAGVRGRSEVLGDILPAVDSLDLALGSSDRDGAAGPVLDGVEMVRKQFLAAMSRHGVKPVETAPGKVFDPAVHEAVAQIPSEDQPLGTVVEEMRKGYLLGERLLRAAMVIVSAGPPDGGTDEDVETEPEPETETETETEETDG
ncbi:MAG: nucleotide exchange factor GrpE, partial [Deltaproteobacteria bacterium]|nr:nucleotide exchange factor GrpE [Deltaproteobacteria bacterium]